MTLQAALGVDGHARDHLVLHSRTGTLIYSIGPILCFEQQSQTRSQRMLVEHAVHSSISCLSLSANEALLASGAMSSLSYNEDPLVIIWEVDRQVLKSRLHAASPLSLIHI
eukprot:TRINITY_DN33572_c0_g1_i1.p2 TRINITY_DN33572_c0_g1~~TRINITY_DN33572_c0_g1_i1.p2  ORF type:complete len:111 (-),score=20.39 TRINITY_DN33572_c0_g1_i1:149-481(-)